MTKVNVQTVVHESETQRQFVRLPVPAQARIGDNMHYVKDLSSGGLSLVDVNTSYAEGARLPLSLTLPFSAFSLQIILDAQVKYYLPTEKVMGVQFMGLSADQVSLLNHVVKSFMAGEIVKSGDLLNVAARENFTKSRGKKVVGGDKPVVELKRQIPGLILVSALGVLALSFIGANLYESLFVLKTNNAYVQGPITTVRAVEQGVFISKLPAGATTVKNRQEVGMVNDTSKARVTA
jgi:alginate biosynthesis protein Alg44